MKKLAILALTLLSACAGVRKPEVELEGISLGGLGLSGGTLLVNLEVKNPNSFGIRAERLLYDLYLRDTRRDADGDSAWVSIAEGTYDEDIEIRGGETRDVRIPVDFSYSDLGSAARQLLRSGRFDYRATGSVDVRTSFGARTVPFRKTGTVYLSGNNDNR